MAEIINNKIKQIYEHSGIKSIVTPYESQPFQNKVFKEAQKNNIKTIVSNHSEVNSRNSVHLHVSTTEYENIDLKQIYKYPSDRFSHLSDYSLLSKKISFSLKKQLKLVNR